MHKEDIHASILEYIQRMKLAVFVEPFTQVAPTNGPFTVRDTYDTPGLHAMAKRLILLYYNYYYADASIDGPELQPLRMQDRSFDNTVELLVTIAGDEAAVLDLMDDTYRMPVQHPCSYACARLKATFSYRLRVLTNETVFSMRNLPPIPTREREYYRSHPYIHVEPVPSINGYHKMHIGTNFLYLKGFGSPPKPRVDPLVPEGQQYIEFHAHPQVSTL